MRARRVSTDKLHNLPITYKSWVILYPKINIVTQSICLAGSFVLPSVRPGTYSVYAFVPGFFGTFQSGQLVAVNASTPTLLLGDLTFTPPRLGPTVWEIGVPDRSAGNVTSLVVYQGLNTTLFTEKFPYSF